MIAIKQAHGRPSDASELQALYRRMQSIEKATIGKHERVVSMRWSYGEPKRDWPMARHVILRFVAFPNHRIGIYSDDLGEYLEALGTEFVDVTFRLTYDKSSNTVVGTNCRAIGELTEWQQHYSYSGVSGDAKPSPWDDVVVK